MTDKDDEAYMGRAVMWARLAAHNGERPFGSLIVNPEGMIIGSGSGSETPWDPTRHSEVASIRAACGFRQKLLQGCTMYTTHEPCIMCIGAILHSKLSRVVFGSWRSDLPDLFRQRDYSVVHLMSDTSHPPEITPGILRDECVELFTAEVAEARRGAAAC
jgi:tRNA(adenine34) deaminase